MNHAEKLILENQLVILNYLYINSKTTTAVELKILSQINKTDELLKNTKI